LRLLSGALLDLVDDGNSGLNPMDNPDHILHTCQQARTAAKQLGSDREKPELVWINTLEQLASKLRGALTTSDEVTASVLLDDVQRRLRLQLSMLNEHVFEMATTLQFPGLLDDLRQEFEDDESFPNLEHAIRDLKPTVLARALEHTIWQEVDDQISLLADLVICSNPREAAFVEHWFLVRKRIRWLCAIDPSASWAQVAASYAEDIDDELADEHADEDTASPLVNRFIRIIRLRFLEVDARLKRHWASLNPISNILSDITAQL
jgi:hypothetical protein